jgi:replicative DNA helicase
MLTVTDALRKSGELERVGGAVFIAGLTSSVGSAMHIKHHAAILYEKWIAREMIRVGSGLVEKSFSGTDVMDLMSDTEKEIAVRKLHFLGLTSTGVSIMDAANQSLDEYYIRENNQKNNITTGVPTTFKKLDKYTGGFQGGQLIVLAGRPGMGKTSVAISFLIHAAKVGKKVFMASLEMTSARLMDKVLCSEAEINHADYKGGRLSDDDRNKAEGSLDEFAKWGVTFNDDMVSNIDQIHAIAKAQKERGGLDFLIIDYLQLMRSRERAGNREQEVSQISRATKMMAVDLDIPILLLAQLNRGVEERPDKRPMLSDLRESGAIEQDADIVLFVYRDCVYNDAAPAESGELLISKHREGPTGSIDFWCNESLTRFKDAEPVNTYGAVPEPIKEPLRDFSEPIRDFSEPTRNDDFEQNDLFYGNPNK